MSSLFDLLPSFSPRRVEVPSQKSDNWFTPWALWTKLDSAYGYNCDAFGHHLAPVSLAIAARNGDLFTEKHSFLGIPFECVERSSIWANPPYSQPLLGEAVEWCVHLMSRIAHGPELITMLLPAKKSEQPFWQTHIEPFRDRGILPGARDEKWSCTTRYLPGRLAFGHPEDPPGAKSESAMFPSVLVSLVRYSRDSWRETKADPLRSLEL